MAKSRSLKTNNLKKVFINKKLIYLEEKINKNNHCNCEIIWFSENLLNKNINSIEIIGIKFY